jgi:hypothetical protein
MAVPETQLVTWAKQGSITQSSTTYATIKRALEASETKYADKSYEVFLQGSYGNDTNIYAESDVDVVIRLDAIYHYDIEALTPAEQATFNAVLVPGTYPYAEYKADVIAALAKSFGAADVNPRQKSSQDQSQRQPTQCRCRGRDPIPALLFRTLRPAIRAWDLLFQFKRQQNRQLSKTTFCKLHDETPGDESVV